MIILEGKHNTAKVFCDNVEKETMAQIYNLINQEFVAGSKIRIMPDTHAGAGCTIGTTMTVSDKIVPNLVGVDIGCGMETVVLQEGSLSLDKLDRLIHEAIPSGFSVRDKSHKMAEKTEIEGLRCLEHINASRAMLSIGTLGGGNHFIELGADGDGLLYLVIHSGSRNLGLQVAKHYQREAEKSLKKQCKDAEKLIAQLKAQGRHSEIQTEIKKIKPAKVDKNLAYLQGQLFDDYIHDMKIVQNYAEINRKTIAMEILKGMGLNKADSFTTIHNYIDLESMILRKGAVSAKKGERLLIPINMRDGSLLCIGKGNPDWNFSAPHGAGRIMSRSEAKRRISIEDFKESMKGIYSSTIDASTLDEAPFAYKPMEEITDNIGDTADIIKTIRPLYNFKAAE